MIEHNVRLAMGSHECLTADEAVANILVYVGNIQFL